MDAFQCLTFCCGTYSIHCFPWSEWCRLIVNHVLISSSLPTLRHVNMEVIYIFIFFPNISRLLCVKQLKVFGADEVYCKQKTCLNLLNLRMLECSRMLQGYQSSRLLFRAQRGWDECLISSSTGHRHQRHSTGSVKKARIIHGSCFGRFPPTHYKGKLISFLFVLWNFISCSEDLSTSK